MNDFYFGKNDCIVSNYLSLLQQRYLVGKKK